MPRMVGASKPPTKSEAVPAPCGSAWQPLPCRAVAAGLRPERRCRPGGLTPPLFSKKSEKPSTACTVSWSSKRRVRAGGYWTLWR